MIALKEDRSQGHGCRHFIVNDDAVGQRVDLYLTATSRLAGTTRSMVQNLIRAGLVLVNHHVTKAGYRVATGDRIEVTIPPLQPTEIQPEPVSFLTIYEDESLVVLSKPPGVVVHPSCGHQSGTLVHGLLYACSDLSGISGEERPGIVHRLDKDTSGIMVVAKNDKVHHALIRQFKMRQVEKSYLAILTGNLSPIEGRIAEPIGRHAVHRKKMAIRREGGREAATTWKVLESLPGYCYVQLGLETGRTHQIRVHMSHLGHPIAGDSIYGGRRKEDGALAISRQCLHSYRLSFVHPVTDERMVFKAPLWDDMENTLQLLRQLHSR